MSTECIKRKRGRPRRDEQLEISDSDLDLIREYASRPAFYDRACVHYRNRDYLEQQWEEMATNLGCKVSTIKMRMQHLRTRYYTEKRRLEIRQDHYNPLELNSNWPLFEYMNFLGDHMRTRRTYNFNNSNSNNDPKTLQSLALDQLSHNSNISDETNSDNANYTADADVKHKVNGEIRINNISSMQGNSEHISVSIDPLTLPSQPLRRINLQRLQTQRENNILSGELTNGVAQPPADKCAAQKKEKYANIYKTFGQFLTASLIEMDENVALQLVNKFTSELVQSLHTERNVHPEGASETIENVSN